jgi:hypothetical protein
MSFERNRCGALPSSHSIVTRALSALFVGLLKLSSRAPLMLWHVMLWHVMLLGRERSCTIRVAESEAVRFVTSPQSLPPRVATVFPVAIDADVRTGDDHDRADDAVQRPHASNVCVLVLVVCSRWAEFTMRNKRRLTRLRRGFHSVVAFHASVGSAHCIASVSRGLRRVMQLSCSPSTTLARNFALSALLWVARCAILSDYSCIRLRERVLFDAYCVSHLLRAKFVASLV